MLKVKTKLKNSQIHGIGLFADQFIPKGTIVWQRNPLLDIGIFKDKIDTLEPLEKDVILHYAYLDIFGYYILCGDDARFMNHSYTPNLDSRFCDGIYDDDIASKDIEIGEEIVCDYRSFDQSHNEKLKA